MLDFVVRRIVFAAFIIFAAVTLVFFIVLGVGDPCLAAKPNATKDVIDQCRASHGFDESVFEQYGSYLGLTECVKEGDPDYDGGEGHCGLLQGNFGRSMTYNESTLNVLLKRLPRTLLLGAVTLFIEFTLGLGLGIIAAFRRNSWFDTGFMAAAFLGISAPSFFTGLLFLYVAAFLSGWFPIGGYGVGFWDHIYHAILPAFTLAIIGAATYARVMRSEMIDTLQADYIRTARAKGASEMRVIFGHAIRNAMLPIVTMMGLSLTLLVSGAVITESIFSWPGMGKLVIESITNNDIWIVLTVVVFSSATVQVGNLIADIAVAALDPRIRISSKS